MFKNMISDYEVADQCENIEAYYVCLKCGKCGRKFDKGVMVDDGGTTLSEDEQKGERNGKTLYCFGDVYFWMPKTVDYRNRPYKRGNRK